MIVNTRLMEAYIEKDKAVKKCKSGKEEVGSEESLKNTESSCIQETKGKL